jgi:hypothetical protein
LICFSWQVLGVFRIDLGHFASTRITERAGGIDDPMEIGSLANRIEIAVALDQVKPDAVGERAGEQSDGF